MVEVKSDVSVRPLREGELSDADRIMRLAFGTFLGLPEPMTFIPSGYSHCSRRAPPSWKVDPGFVDSSTTNSMMFASSLSRLPLAGFACTSTISRRRV